MAEPICSVVGVTAQHFQVSLVVGTRPQLIKAAQLQRINDGVDNGLDLTIIDSGQHYDDNLASSEVTGLEGRVRLELESDEIRSSDVLMRAMRQSPAIRSADVVATVGDTNSTLAATLVAADLGRPVVHVEAGLRSFDRAMPEERNRLVADHLSDLLFAPSQRAVDQLTREQLGDRAVFTGDITYDLLRHHIESGAVHVPSTVPAAQVVLTVHRPSNTDDPARREAIFRLAAAVSRDTPVLFPAHPRISAAAHEFFRAIPSVSVIEPMKHLELLSMLASSTLVITDSGGIQREAFWLSTRCVTLRTETEWVETLDDGRNTLAGPDDVDEIIDLGHRPLDRSIPVPPVYGSGNASTIVLDEIRKMLAI